jgi:hypothetical protein
MYPEMDGGEHALWYVATTISYLTETLTCILPRSGSVVEHSQDQVSRSRYLQRLEETEESTHESRDRDEQRSELDPDTEIRYWSDYSHPYYTPRSIHKVPDSSGGARSDTMDWTSSQAMFKQYDAVRVLSITFSEAHAAFTHHRITISWRSRSVSSLKNATLCR